jgi:hypothetical protein
MSAVQVANILGVPSHSVLRWITAGYIQAKRNGWARRDRKTSKRQCYDKYTITALALMDFLDNRLYWPLIEVAHIPDLAWSEYAEQSRRDAGGEWLTLRQYAALLGLSPDGARRRLVTGQDDAERIILCRRLYVWREDV